MRCCMLEKAKKKVCTYKITAARSKVLNYEILRAHLAGHSWVNCLDCNYQSLDPLSNGWIFVDGALQPLCYEGASQPYEEQIENYLP